MAASFSPRAAAGTPVIQLTDDEKEETCANAELTLLFHLSAERKMGCFQLGGELHRSLNLRRFVQLTHLGFNWFAAKFKSRIDYNVAFRTGRAHLFGTCVIQFYQWQLNFQPFLLDGDIVEGRLQQIPPEYCTDRLITKIADTACASLRCRVLRIDSKSSRFLFQSVGTNSCSRLPLQIQIGDGGPLVVLSYSPAQQCNNCGGFGHLSRNCRGNRATFSSSVPTHAHAQAHAQVRHPPLHPEPVPMADPRESGTHLQNTNPPETHGETTPMAPIPSSTGITTPPRSIPEMEMPAKGAIILEMGRESKPRVYPLLEEVSEINVTLNVTPLNDQRGNLRRVTIVPRTDIALNCTKRVLYTSIDGAENQDAIRMLLDKCSEGNISVAIVLDKSSVLSINDRIVRYLGFSAFHRAEMTFPSFRSDCSSMDVQGNCLIMWREEVRVDVSAVNTERHLNFSATWVVGESDEEDSDGLSQCFTTTCGEEGFSDSSDSSESSSNGDTDSEVSSLYYTAGEELSNESDDESSVLSSDADTLSPYYGDADTEESSFFSTSGEERSHEASTSSSSRSDSSIFPEEELSNESSSYSGSAEFDESPPRSPNSDANLSPYAESDSEGLSFLSVSGESSSESSTVSPNRDTNSEESWSSSTDAEEISYGSSAPCTSSEEGDESFYSFS